MQMVEIIQARFPEQLEIVRDIFREYAQNLGVDLCFQNFESELENLPGKYAAPLGCVLLAWSQGQVLGCVALRPAGAAAGEMKRLYVRPVGRGLGLGLQLATAICATAKTVGYQTICLDTLPTMKAALHIYAAMGFQPIPAYVFNPLAGAIYLGLDLTG